MTAEEARKQSQNYWQLSENEIKAYEKMEAKPYGEPINISRCLIRMIDSAIENACNHGKLETDINLFNGNSLQGWQIAQMKPYLRWYYMKQGYKFTMYGCDVTISWGD